MSIRCQEFCIYYLTNFPKQPCKLVIKGPMFQMEKSNQEAIDLFKVTR